MALEPGVPHATMWPGPRHTADELTDIGRSARKQVPRRRHAEFSPAPGRDPLAILAAQATTRVPELVPIRHARMAVSPFTFFRGAAAVMAADLATTATTGLRVQICGDAHLLNFGAYGTPERHVAFDVNDFDETLPGPFEWDLKRLAASVVVAATDHGFTTEHGRAAAAASVTAYQRSMATLAATDTLDAWYSQVNLDDLATALPKQMRPRLTRQIDRARRHTSAQAVAKLTTTDGGQRRIMDDPPLIVHFDDEVVRARLAALFSQYRTTLASDRRHLFDRYEVLDVARKVVGVGSVGTRCYIVLMQAVSDHSPLFLQVKQAEASVLEPFVGPAIEDSGGERVVAGQRLMQASSDIFLGWSHDNGHDFYLRQLRDMKGSANLDAMGPDNLTMYAMLCGSTLARAHARTGTATAVSAYLGTSSTLAGAIAEFAVAYATVNAADHAAFVAAIAQGRIDSAPSA